MSYQSQWIRASEINDYVYCNRAWWLQQMQDVPNENVRQLTLGEQHHQDHNQQVREMVWVRRLAYTMLFIVVAVATFQFLLGL